jgi:hypothetical protein
VGDGNVITGVGFWFLMLNGLPAAPKFIIRIYNTGPDGCPEGAPLFVANCDVVQIGPGDGSITNPIEYFCDFSDNGFDDFLKESGVEYAISIQNNNCPDVEAWEAFWATGFGDGNYGCADLGGGWVPLEDLGFLHDLAMYLCNEELPIEPTFCDDPDIKNIALPDGVVGLAASECFGNTGPVEQTERFFGDNMLITGVGFWFNMLGGLPAQPTFIIRIYETGADGCPLEPPLFVANCNVVQIGPGTGSVADPIEYFCDFSDNGHDDFFKEEGVEYSISIMNTNCPGEGFDAFWASGAGDGLYGCIIGPDHGIPVWTPKADLGFPWDNAMYLCNAPVPVEFQPSLALHAELSPHCNDVCPNVVVDWPNPTLSWFHVIVRNYGPDIVGLQAAFDWDTGAWIWLGWEQCQPGQLTILVPSAPGADLVTAFDCVVGGVGVVVGRQFMFPTIPLGCLSVITSSQPGGTAFADCASNVITIDPDCYGRVCMTGDPNPGINACDCPAPGSSVEGTSGLTSSLMLSQPTPNPTTRSMTYSITLERESRVRVQVHDVTGRVVSRPVDESLPAGVHTFAWTALDGQGRNLPAGVYYLSANADGAKESRKFVLMR